MQRPLQSNVKILVTGATGFLGYRVVIALLEAGVSVSVLVQPDRQESLAPLAEYVDFIEGDVWNKASLKGRARNHQVVVHLVGSHHIDPARGLTYNQINLVSARHVTAMAVSDGVPHMVLLSTIVRPLDLPGAYVRSKRDAESYLIASGLHWTVVRAPALYLPQQSSLLRLVALLGGLVPFRWLIGRYLPLSVNVAARGIAGVALNPMAYHQKTIYVSQLRRIARKLARQTPAIRPISSNSRYAEDVESPFGWMPPR